MERWQITHKKVTMSNTIGLPPKQYFTDEQLQTFTRSKLMSIVSENDWITIIGEDKTLADWQYLSDLDLFVMVSAKMNEYQQEVTL